MAWWCPRDRKSVVEGKSVDLGVTGVQTCALPIFAADILEDLGVGSIALMTNNPAKVNALRADGVVVSKRSEERRGGKECRSRCDWSSDVCSSDLRRRHPGRPRRRLDRADDQQPRQGQRATRRWRGGVQEIGRASWRERV